MNTEIKDNPPKRVSKIIWDEPSAEDKFKAGGHSKSATVLANAIGQLKDRNGAIGLEGVWGAGKSTVIKLAEEILEESHKEKKMKEKYCIFSFDLWAHQSEDFRRAFLESFVDWLEMVVGLPESIAEEKRGIIRDKVKEVVQKNQKVYSWLGIVSIALLPILPFSYQLFGSVINKLPDKSKLFEFEIDNAVLAAISLVPPLILVGLFLARAAIEQSRKIKISKYGKRSFYQWRVDWRKGFLESLSKAVSLFSRSVDVDTTTQNIRDSDPTTIEFHRVFREILSAVQTEEKQIIVVLDNIDRLPKGDIPLVWSEMRALFAINETSEQSKNSHVTAVVPYDREFISPIFKDERNQENSSEDEDNKIDVFEKTFNRIIRVSPPILTNWKEFFCSKLSEAIQPDLEQESKDRIFKMLQRHFDEKRIQVTPRKIISFINEFSPLCEQWDGEIAPETIALYILYKSKIEKDFHALENPSLVDARYLRLANISDWQIKFAALAYNVALEDAKQVLLTQPIKSAIAKNNPDQFVNLANSEGFNDVLTEVIEDNIHDWAVQDSKTIPNIIRNILSVNLPQYLKDHIWNLLNQKIPEMHKLDLTAEEDMESLYEILKNQPKERMKECSEELLGKIYSSAIEEEEDGTLSDGRTWLYAIIPITRFMSGGNQNEHDTILHGVSVPEGVEFALGIASACSKQDDVAFEDFNIEVEEQEIIKAANERINSSPILFGEILGEIIYLLSKENKVSCINQITAKLSSTTKLNSDDRHSLLFALVELCEQEYKNDWSPFVAAKIKDGTLIAHAHAASIENKQSDAALVLWLAAIVGLKGFPEIADNHTSFGSMSGAKVWYQSIFSETVIPEEFIATLANLVVEYEDTVDWIRHAINDDSSNGFYREVIKRAVNDGMLTVFNTNYCITNYPTLKKILGDDLSKKFLEQFSSWNQYFNKETLGKFLLKIPNKFIYDCQEVDNAPKFIPILEEIDGYLRALQKEDWKQSLLANDDNIRLLLVRVETGAIELPTHEYNKPIENYTIDIIKGNATPAYKPEEMGLLYKAVKPRNLKAMANDILLELENIPSNSAGINNFVKFSQALIKHIDFEKNPDVALTKFFTPLLSSEDLEIREYIKLHQKVIPACIKKAQEDSVGIVDEAIESLEENSSLDLRAWGEQLRKMTGIEKKEDSQEEGEKIGEQAESSLA